jgi:hypothetical protein
VKHPSPELLLLDADGEVRGLSRIFHVFETLAQKYGFANSNDWFAAMRDAQNIEPPAVTTPQERVLVSAAD